MSRRSPVPCRCAIHTRQSPRLMICRIFRSHNTRLPSLTRTLTSARQSGTGAKIAHNIRAIEQNSRQQRQIVFLNQSNRRRRLLKAVRRRLKLSPPLALVAS